MKIKNYILSQKEEALFLTILDEFRKTFSYCEIFERDTILGIGIKNKKLFCYLTHVGNSTYIKFKSEENKLLFDENLNFAYFANKTIRLYIQDPALFKLKAKGKENKTILPPKTPSSKTSNLGPIAIGDTVTVIIDHEEIEFTILKSYAEYKTYWTGNIKKPLENQTVITSDANYNDNKTISEDSPLAQAVLGKKLNELFEFESQGEFSTGKIVYIKKNG